MTHRCEDWRDVSAAHVEPLVAAEVRAWREHLGWDVAEAWGVIEPARASGQLPGFVARDLSGRVTGWTCFLLHRGSLQVIALVASNPGATRALVEAVLASPEAEVADTAVVSVRDAAPGLRDTLAAQGLEIANYRYLSLAMPRRSHRRDTAPAACRPWKGADAEAISRLCARAYAPSREVRAFAVHGTPEEWREYIASLLATPDCGRFLAEASFVVPGREPNEIDGAVITTCLAPGTAHIAQLAVDPAVRGRGFGQRLVQTALSAAERAGLTRATLLVSAANTQAAAIYQAQGFQDHATFVVAA